MSENKILQPTTIIIFGATGDLAKRKLFPAFYNLYKEGRMPEQFNIVALGRTDNTNENFRDYIKNNLETFSRNQVNENDWGNFESHITYLKHEIDSEDSYINLKEQLNDFDAINGTRSNRLFIFQ